MDDVRARLGHVLWIGGGPQAGKTTLSRLLAGKWDLKIYNIDWHAYPMAHQVCADEIADLRRWLDARLR